MAALRDEKLPKGVSGIDYRVVGSLLCFSYEESVVLCFISMATVLLLVSFFFFLFLLQPQHNWDDDLPIDTPHIPSLG